MAKHSIAAIEAARKLLQEVSQERREEKYTTGWQYKEALEYLCENAVGMKLSDIFTSSNVRYQLANGSYWYGTGKWPLEMNARVDALMAAEPKLKTAESRAKVKYEFNKDKPLADGRSPEEKARALELKQAEVRSLAADLARDFVDFLESQQQAENAPLAPPPAAQPPRIDMAAMREQAMNARRRVRMPPAGNA